MKLNRFEADATMCEDWAPRLDREWKNRLKYRLALRLLREERERSEGLRDAVRWAYEGGHNDTVDGCFGDSEEVADEIVADLDDEVTS